MTTVEMIDETTVGEYLIRTESGSLYCADFDRMILRREPGLDSNQLRGDQEEVEMVGYHVRVGFPGTFVLKGLSSENVTTIRTTTTVQSIEVLRHFGWKA